MSTTPTPYQKLHVGQHVTVMTGWDRGSRARIVGKTDHHVTVNVAGRLTHWTPGTMPEVR